MELSVASLQMVRQCDLHIISKLRNDSALYFPYDGEYSGRGRHTKYGTKINYKHISKQYLKSSQWKYSNSYLSDAGMAQIICRPFKGCYY